MSEPGDVTASPGTYTEDVPTAAGAPARDRGHLPMGALAIGEVPMALAGRDRAAWRVTTLSLCLASCWGRTASVEQLHVLTWALRDERNAQQLLGVWTGARSSSTRLRAWNPKLPDTLRLARAANLIELKSGGKYKLTEDGVSLVSAIREQEDAFIVEQQLLAQLGQITESGMWRTLGEVGLREVSQ